LLPRSALAALLVTLACSDPSKPDEPAEITSCAGNRGIVHDSAGTETWRRQDGPHRLRGQVRVRGTLTIEPGTLVCGAAGSTLSIPGDATRPELRGRLLAQGTPQRPIVFTAEVAGAPWGGISIGMFLNAPSRIANALIEHATTGVNAWYTIQIDSTRFRQITSYAVAFIYYATDARIFRSVIDTAGTPTSPAVSLDGRTTIEETVIRGARGDGLFIGRMSNVRILGGSIEGSGGIGLTTHFQGAGIQDGRPVRISGGAGRSVRVSATVFQKIWPTPMEQAQLRGNAIDTPQVDAALGGGELIIGPDLPVRFSLSVGVGSVQFGEASTLTLLPGATISGEVLINGRLNAQGTATAPITVQRMAIAGTRVDTTRLSNIRVRQLGFLQASQRRTVIIDGLQADSSVIVLRSSGSRLTNAVIDRGAVPPTFGLPPAALVLGAAGVTVERTVVRRSTSTVFSALPPDGVLIETSGVTLRECEVSGNAGAGVRAVAATDVHINDCNIESNGGFGANNTTGASLDARGNWWGDPAGPMGPNGDGVSANVDFSQFRSTRLPFASALGKPKR
jgi:hypothetical protein